MKITELLKRVKTPLFFDYQLERLFPQDPKPQINIQLARLARAGMITRLKRGLYAFSHAKIDEFVLANFIYRPSYVSLESALNYYGIIPDVVPNVTSVSPTTTRNFRIGRELFIYSKIARDLYFGWQMVKDAGGDFYFAIAEPEKAVLDFVYIRKIRDLGGHRLDLTGLNRKKLINYAKIFPAWVRETINEQYRH
jgi:predicted transcriptional regulator of viral defense system